MNGRDYSDGRRLHVGQFIDSMDPGGAEGVVISLCRELPRRGIRVTVFHFGNPWLTEKLELEGVDSVVLSARYYKSALKLPAFLINFLSILKDNDVDLVHSHLLGATFAGSLAARMAGIPSIGTIHDVYSVKQSKMNARYLRWAQYLGCELVAVCDSMREEIIDHCGLGRMERIYNGIDVGHYEVDHQNEITPDTVTVITVARAVPIKRLDLLLDAVALLAKDSSFQLVVVGDGPTLADLQRKSTELGLDDVVEFLGHRDDVPELLRGSHIFVQVSDSEGLSISILEAMAAGLPSVVTDVGGNKELVENNATGFIVPPGDERAIYRRLAELIAQPKMREAFGLAAKAKVEQSFGVQSMSSEYANFMLTLAKRHV